MNIVNRFFALCATVCAAMLLAMPLAGDILKLADSRVISNCFVCDRGINLWFWHNFAAVHGLPRVVPASRVSSFVIDRSLPQWDKQPRLPDLSVTHISRTPRLPGLHGNVIYDVSGAPGIAPEMTALVARTAFTYTPGQIITLTAHVRNVGFVPAAPFSYVWKLNGRVVATGSYARMLPPMEDATFAHTFAWYERPTAEFIVKPRGQEILAWNNRIKDYLWGDDFFFTVSKGCVNIWHQNRSLQGSFSFEDYYRWHIDVMNDLLAASAYPAAPSGCLERVRLDRIIYADNIEEAKNQRRHADGFFYDQGGWIWEDVATGKSHVPIATRNPDGSWEPPSKQWRNQTEWSLPHELGHQLGLIDWYNFDEPGVDWHTAPDTGERITHLMDYPKTMMHWHGPHPYTEVDAAYLGMTRDKPRGFFGDFVFAMPLTNTLLVLDINGQPLPGAQVEIFQRGVAIDTNAAPMQLDGATVFPVIEDGDFGKPLSRLPVITGTTDAQGRMMLPNRPVTPATTFNGITRHPNPFGNVNVVGGRGLLLIKVTSGGGTPQYFWLDNYHVNVAWFRGHHDVYTFVLKTPYGSPDSPLPPRMVRATAPQNGMLSVSWQAPPQRDRHVHDHVTGYRVYRRIGNDGLDNRPWFAVATLPATNCTADISCAARPDELHYFGKTERVGVTAIGSNGRESALVSAVVPQ